MRSPECTKALINELHRHEHAEWRRGIRDCGTFASDCLKVVCGIDPMGPLRGQYDSSPALVRLLSKLGFRGLEGYIESWCNERGYPEMNAIFAQIGDLGVTNNGIPCVRAPAGFVAFGEAGGLHLVNPKRVWAIAWD